ncbi:MAG: hypothetical protein U0525_05120 [Patescibacteria group bacterium]
MEKSEHTPKHENHSNKMVHLKHEKTAHNLEDLVSTVGVIVVSAAFLLYVVLLAFNQASIVERNERMNSVVQNNQGNLVFPFLGTNNDCKKMNGNFEACVKSQAEGSGCSWYAGCDACIYGSHEGRKKEELCKK